MSHADLRIRRATVADLRELQAVARDTYLDHFARYWSPQGLADYLEREFGDASLAGSLASPAHAWLLAETVAGAVGYAKINWHRIEPASGLAGAELQKIYLRAASTGHGHGARLLAQVVALAGARGEPRIWLNVLKPNTAARRFYAAHGFATTGEVPLRSDLGDEIGKWVMIRAL